MTAVLAPGSGSAGAQAWPVRPAALTGHRRRPQDHPDADARVLEHWSAA